MKKSIIYLKDKLIELQDFCIKIDHKDSQYIRGYKAAISDLEFYFETKYLRNKNK